MSAKLSYQLTKNNRLVYAWQRGTKAQPQNNADRFTPLESTRDYKNPTAIQKIELQSMINPQVLVNAVAGYSGYVTDYDAARSYARADAPPRQDLATTLNTGSAPLHQNKTRDRFQTDDSISFFPERSFAGKHEFKTGISIYLDKSSDGYSNNLACNCILYTDTIGGVPNTPSQIRIYNTPVVPADHDNTYAVVPEGQLAAIGQADGQPRRPLGAAALVPAGAGLSRARATGRPYSRPARTSRSTCRRSRARCRALGLAWDLGGKSGREGDVRPLQLHARRHLRRRLQPECDRERRVHLARSERRQALSAGRGEPQRLNSSDFRSITAASNQILNPNLKSPNIWETTASWERELAANMGLRVMYVNKLVSGSIVNSTNNLVSINTLRPYSAWSVPITRRDPGPDGVLGNARRRGKRDALRLHAPRTAAPRS